LKNCAIYVSCQHADQIGLDEFEQLDELHYKVENQLIKLIASLQKKQKDEPWEDNFQAEPRII